jgi:hypothetical protein
MPRGYVALVDVLGFTNTVVSRGEEGVTAYLDCLQGVQQASGVDYIAFSDSIVLTRAGGEADDLAVIVGACSRLFAELLRQRIAVCGAISYGEFVRKVVNGSVFGGGRAIIDAYRFEQAQDWVGIMLAPSARERVADLAAWCNLDSYHVPGRLVEIYRDIGWSARLRHWPSIPFHTDNPFDQNSYAGYAVLPTAGGATAAEVRDDLQAALNQLSWLRELAPEPRIQRKYSAAISFLNTASAPWHNIAHAEGQLREQGAWPVEQK